MPNGDDGYGEFGGNGSVQWIVDVNNTIWHHSDPKNSSVLPTGHRQGGASTTEPGKRFRLSLETPKTYTGKDPLGDFIADLANAGKWTRDGNRAYFELVIEERNSDQIRISWPHP